MRAAHLYRRDLSTIRRMANDVLRQCEHYERNTAGGADDSLRFGLLYADACLMLRAARRAYRRVHRERGWGAEWVR